MVWFFAQSEVSNSQQVPSKLPEKIIQVLRLREVI